MTSNPPKITSVPAETPSNEWASKTESIFQSDTIPTDPTMKPTSKSDEHPEATITNLNTPGHEFPGSYPKELEIEEEEQRRESRDNGSEGSPMASVVHAAKQYMPDNVERTVEYASQRAAAYLPIPQGIRNTVTSYWSDDQRQGSQSQGCEGTDPPLSTSLPSSETKGAQPFEHVGGVGSLPGTLSESSVALLPDERAAKTPVGKDGSKTPGNNQAKSTAIFTRATGTAEAPVPSKSPLSLVQSSEDKTQTETQQVGKASTATSDEPHAELPKRGSDTLKSCEAPEKQRSNSHATETADGRAGPAAGQMQTKDAGQWSEPVVARPYATIATSEGSRVVEAQACDLGETTTTQDSAGGTVEDSKLSKDDHEHKQAESMSRETQVVKGSNTQEDDPGVKEHRPSHIRANEANSEAEAQPSPTSATTTSASDSHKEPKERRVSFLHKVRGEVKVIAGKISGKEDKVEEGRRIIHGEL